MLRAKKKGSTPLHWAAGNGHLKVVEKLIEKGADISAKDEEGRTPLDLANLRGRSEVANLLKNKQNEYYQLLGLAVSDNSPDQVMSLLSRGANVNTKDDVNNMTLLHWATRYGYFEVADLLIRNGANVNATGDSHSMTPLHLAVRYRHFEIAALLIENGANINIQQGKDNVTPLHLAARIGLLDIVKLLVERGADISAKNEEGRTPLDLANLRGRSEVVNFLEQEEIRRNEGTIQHQYSQEEDNSPSILIGTRNRRSIAKEDKDSLQNFPISYSKGKATSGASKPSSWIGSIVNWIKGSTESPALLTSREHDNITVIAVPEITATLVNNTIMLAILAAGRYRQPIHENLLSPREQSMRLNNIDEDMIIRAMQESEEIGDPNTCMDEVEVSGNKTEMRKGGK